MSVKLLNAQNHPLHIQRRWQAGHLPSLELAAAPTCDPHPPASPNGSRLALRGLGSAPPSPPQAEHRMLSKEAGSGKPGRSAGIKISTKFDQVMPFLLVTHAEIKSAQRR